jgi:hypothetical protein
MTAAIWKSLPGTNPAARSFVVHSFQFATFVSLAIMLPACRPSVQDAVQAQEGSVARSYTHADGPVDATIQLEPTDEGSMDVAVVLRVRNPKMDAEYHYKQSMSRAVSSPFELWVQDRHMYDLVLPHGLTWGDLIALAPMPPHGPVLLRIEGAAEEPDIR